MKKYFFVLTIIGFIIVKTANSQSGGAMLSLNKMVHDFGTIKEEAGKAFVIFEFTNAGKAPLVIHRIVSSCDCAAVDWTKEPLAPGANGIIKVIFNPKGRPGKFEKLITIYSNSEKVSMVLVIKGIVQERIKTVEEVYSRTQGDFRFVSTNVAFGRVFIDEVKVDTIEFMCFANEPVKIGAKVMGLPHLSVRFVPEILKPQEKGLMIVTYNAKIRNDWGFNSERFYLTQNDKDIIGSIIYVSASIEENFTALTNEQKENSPKIDFHEPNYEFGEVEEGKLVEKEFVFTNIGKSDLIIRKIKASCGCTSVDPADKVIKPGKKSSFKASIKTDGFTGRIAKSITIITNDPVNPTVVVRLVGIVNPVKK